MPRSPFSLIAGAAEEQRMVDEQMRTRWDLGTLLLIYIQDVFLRQLLWEDELVAYGIQA